MREWRALPGRIRGGSAIDLLLRSLAGAPVLTVGSAAMIAESSLYIARAGDRAGARQAMGQALDRLLDGLEQP